MRIQYEDVFDSFKDDDKSRVFQLFPDYYGDNRGYFMEVLKDQGQWPLNDIPMWLSNTDWIRQINRSSSKQGVVRGCHAQRGIFCQGKMVEAVTDRIYDVITDARPDSSTFGVSKVFVLNPDIHNLLWVPRGFLHCVIYPKVKESAILQYYCDNTYNKGSEFCVNPQTLIPDLMKTVGEISKDNLEFLELIDMFKNPVIYSEKDMNSQSYETFVDTVLSEYEKTGKVWYRK